MPSHSRSLYAYATEINVQLIRKLAVLLKPFRSKINKICLHAKSSKLSRIMVDNIAKGYQNALTATIQSKRVYTCIGLYYVYIYNINIYILMYTLCKSGKQSPFGRPPCTGAQSVLPSTCFQHDNGDIRRVYGPRQPESETENRLPI